MTHDEQFTPSGSYYDVSDENLLGSPLVRAVAKELTLRNFSVLDIGCGAGAFARLLGENNRYTGIDLFPGKQTDTFPCPVEFHNIDACTQLPFEDRQFDAVVSFWCLEHLPKPLIALSEAVRVLKPGGFLTLVFPNYDNPFRRCPSWWCSLRDDDSLRYALENLSLPDLLTQFQRRTRYFTRQVVKQLLLRSNKYEYIMEINQDPACAHLPWKRDRDAIHIASGLSVSRYLSELGLLPTAAEGLEVSSVKSWLNWNPEIALMFAKPE